MSRYYIIKFSPDNKFKITEKQFQILSKNCNITSNLKDDKIVDFQIYDENTFIMKYVIDFLKFAVRYPKRNAYKHIKLKPGDHQPLVSSGSCVLHAALKDNMRDISMYFIVSLWHDSKPLYDLLLTRINDRLYGKLYWFHYFINATIMKCYRAIKHLLSLHKRPSFYEFKEMIHRHKNTQVYTGAQKNECIKLYKIMIQKEILPEVD